MTTFDIIITPFFLAFLWYIIRLCIFLRREGNKIKNDKLRKSFYEHLQTHETLNLALIEAVHNFFFHECFDRYTGKLLESETAKMIFDLHQTLCCENPDWRFKLKKKLERYSGAEPTNALDINSKPRKLWQLKSEYYITEKPH